MKCVKDIDKNIFRGYDIRGIYEAQITEDVAYTIGKAYGSIIKTRYNQDTCVIGGDNRESTPILGNALKQGIMDTGVNVIDLGIVTSPMLYYANVLLEKHAGIMITASHNPKEYNGFKIAYDVKGEICGEEIEEFRDFTLAGDFENGNGKLEKYDIREEYIDMLVSKFNFKNRLKVVVDCGNGTSSIIAKDVIDKLNVDAHYIFCESDPSFPNHHPDPAEEENLEDLKVKVIELNADLGIAFDGDGDRVGVVDNQGRMISSDYVMAIIAKNILPKIDNKAIMFDVCCSKTLSDEIKKAGGKPIGHKVGNSYIKREMLKQGMLFGGEISGHFFFKDKFFGFDDGLYGGLRMIEIVDEEGDIAKNHDSLVKYFSTPVWKLDCSDDTKFIVVDKVLEYCKQKGYDTNDIDGARPEFEDGFAIIRCSNTSPKLTVRFEATSMQRLEELKQEFMPVIERLIKEIK